MPRFELFDGMGCSHALDSNDHHTIALWLGEWIPQALSVNSAMPPWQIRVWPTGSETGPEWNAYIHRMNQWMIDRNSSGRLDFVRSIMEIMGVEVTEEGALRYVVERQEAREAAGVRPAEDRPARARPRDGQVRSVRGGVSGH